MAVTKNDLKEYQKMLLALESYDLQISEAYNTYKSPALTATGASRGADPGDPTSRALARIEKLRTARKNLLQRILEIETFVENIDDLYERAICQYHYIIGLTWDATCYQLRKHHSISVVFDYDSAWWAEYESKKQEKEVKESKHDQSSGC